VEAATPRRSPIEPRRRGAASQVPRHNDGIDLARFWIYRCAPGGYRQQPLREGL